MNASRTRLVVLLIIGVFFYVLNNFQRVCLPGTIFNTLQTDLNATATQVAGLGSAFLFVYAFTQFVAGLLVDKYGANRVTAYGAVLFTVASIIFPLTSNIYVMYLCRGLIAFGGGMFYLAIIGNIRDLFPDKYPLVLGMAIFTGFLGGAIGGTPFSAASTALGWRQTMLIVGIFTAVVTAIFLVLARNSARHEGPASKLSLKPYAEVFKHKHNLLVMLAWCPIFGVYYTLPTVLGTKFLQDYAGLSQDVASSSTTVMLIISALMNITTGYLAQRFKRCEKLFLVTTNTILLSGLALATLGIAKNLPGNVFYTAFVIMAVASGFSPVTSNFIQTINPKRLSTTALGMMNALTYTCVSIFGKLTGVVLDTFNDEATITQSAIIYPPKAYLTILATFLGIALVSFIIATCAVPKTKDYQTPL